MAASNALGEKILMFLIGKSTNPRGFKHVSNLPCRYWSQKKAWMDGTLFEERLRKLDREFEMQGRKIVMIVDNCPVHPEVSGLKAIKLQFLPPNTTSCTQSMDQGVIRYILILLYCTQIGRAFCPLPSIHVRLKSLGLKSPNWVK